MAEQKQKKPNEYKKLFVGQELTGANGVVYEVVRHHYDRFYLVRFRETGALQFISVPQAKRVIDRSKPYVDGIGYMDCGDSPIFLGDKQSKDIYSRWMAMIHRCYKDGDGYKTYKDVTVCEEWHNFFNFYNWAKGQPFLLDKQWNLDKDLFSEPDHKIYSPETCCIIPVGLNAQLVNITYDEIHNPQPSEKMHNICEHMSALLLKNEAVLAPRVSQLLWNVCAVNGHPREICEYRRKYKEAVAEKEKFEREANELRVAYQNMAEKDLDGDYVQKIIPTMPIRGYVEHNGKIYRLETAKDLYNMLTMVIRNMKAAPRPGM